jgi:adenylylsulfate kinase-like enzyme
MGLIIWLTGYPNSGKTTLAEKLIQSIKENLNIIPVWIDGDSIRKIFNVSKNQTEEERIELGLKYVRFAKEFYNQGHLVIVSTVAIYKQVYDELFSSDRQFIEIFFVDAALEKRLERDIFKKIYQNRTNLGIDINNLPVSIKILEKNSLKYLSKNFIFLESFIKEKLFISNNVITKLEEFSNEEKV